MNKKIKTKFGTAMLCKDGYYYIKSCKEGNCDKLLHRLIWEDFYKENIPTGYVIHHKNGNKSDNCILNLQLLSESAHKSLHMTKNHPFHKKNHNIFTMLKMSQSHNNTTGYFRVTKRTCKKCKKGFVYSYQYYVGKKQKAIVSTKLDKLKEKVLEKGLIWKKIGDTIEV